MQKVKLLVIVGVLLAATCAWGDATVYNIDSGWFNANGYHTGGNSNYASEGGLSNYFSFDLTGVSGTVTAATFDVNTYSIWGPGVYTLYATPLAPWQVASGNTYTDISLYSALTSGPAIGSIALDPAQSGTWAIISLNSAGLTFLNGNEGGQIVISGSFPSTIAFGSSWFNASNSLVISTTDIPTNAVPEPGSIMLLGSGLAGLFGMLHKKLRK